MKRMLRYIKYLLCMSKLIIAFIYVQIKKRKIYAMNIWLVQEKHTEARDNGYHLYKYLRTKHPEINAFYSITKDAPDRIKLESYGNIIQADSLKHYVYFLAAQKSIGSQAYGACPYPSAFVYRFRFLCRRDQKVVFLQHGIIKDDMPYLYYCKTHFDLFICSAPREHDFVMSRFGYPPEKAKLIGLCRFDRLYNPGPAKRQLLIMPTFRQYLAADKREKEANSNECNYFLSSDFYKQYLNLLTNNRLVDYARKHGYRIIFYLHYALQSYTKLFLQCQNDVVIVADRQHYDVQELLMNSAVLTTDFSSVFFDFAYMNKPEVFFQFDEAEYRKGHYKEGYFDYSKDAFGPVYTELHDVVEYLIYLMENNCVMEKQYQNKVNSFFTLRDNQNCKRCFEAIEAL